MLQRDGLHHSLLSGSTCWTCPPRLSHGQSFCPGCVWFLPVGWWTQDKLVWRYGSSRVPRDIKRNVMKENLRVLAQPRFSEEHEGHVPPDCLSRLGEPEEAAE